MNALAPLRGALLRHIPLCLCGVCACVRVCREMHIRVKRSSTGGVMNAVCVCVCVLYIYIASQHPNTRRSHNTWSRKQLAVTRREHSHTAPRATPHTSPVIPKSILLPTSTIAGLIGHPGCANTFTNVFIHCCRSSNVCTGGTGGETIVCVGGGYACVHRNTLCVKVGALKRRVRIASQNGK